jgi:hypothetical protein
MPGAEPAFRAPPSTFDAGPASPAAPTIRSGSSASSLALRGQAPIVSERYKRAYGRNRYGRIVLREDPRALPPMPAGRFPFLATFAPFGGSSTTSTTSTRNPTDEHSPENLAQPATTCQPLQAPGVFILHPSSSTFGCPVGHPTGHATPHTIRAWRAKAAVAKRREVNEGTNARNPDTFGHAGRAAPGCSTAVRAGILPGDRTIVLCGVRSREPGSSGFVRVAWRLIAGCPAPASFFAIVIFIVVRVWPARDPARSRLSLRCPPFRFSPCLCTTNAQNRVGPTRFRSGGLPLGFLRVSVSLW